MYFFNKIQVLYFCLNFYFDLFLFIILYWLHNTDMNLPEKVACASLYSFGCAGGTGLWDSDDYVPACGFFCSVKFFRQNIESCPSIPTLQQDVTPGLFTLLAGDSFTCSSPPGFRCKLRGGRGLDHLCLPDGAMPNDYIKHTVLPAIVLRLRSPFPGWAQALEPFLASLSPRP